MNTIEAVGSDCVGCGSCVQACAFHAVTMAENDEGFLYPKVDHGLCVFCGQCVSKCPTGSSCRQGSSPIEIYAFRASDRESLSRSASGGFSDAAVGHILDQGGVAYGAAYTSASSARSGTADSKGSSVQSAADCQEFSVRHIEVTDEVSRKLIQSSKYVQSDIGDTYRKARKRLKNGQVVLFTGTPCQIAGLYAFLGGDHPLLYTIDLICHGVPSPGLFRKYLDFRSHQLGEPVHSVNFRSKEGKGWGTQYMLKLESETKTVRRTFALDKYGKHFMDGDCYRESCYRCPYAGIRRIGDLTVGDYWGVWKRHPHLDSPLGVSCVLVNTEKGQELFARVRKGSCTACQISLKDAMAGQSNLSRAASRPPARNTFYAGFAEEDYIKDLRAGLQPKQRLKALLPRGISVLLKAKFQKERSIT